MNKPRRTRLALAATLAFSVTLITAFARHRFPNQADDASQSHPPPNAKWMNTTFSPDERAAMVLKEMTLDEKMNLVHGNGMPGWHGKTFPNAYLGNGGAGFVLGVPRLGIPMIQMSDAAYGVRSSARTAATRLHCHRTLPQRQAGTQTRPVNTAR